MSNNPGPQSHAAAVQMAQQSQTAPQPANTTNWSAVARDNYYAAGGK